MCVYSPVTLNLMFSIRVFVVEKNYLNADY